MNLDQYKIVNLFETLWDMFWFYVTPLCSFQGQTLWTSISCCNQKVRDSYVLLRIKWVKIINDSVFTCKISFASTENTRWPEEQWIAYLYPYGKHSQGNTIWVKAWGRTYSWTKTGKGKLFSPGVRGGDNATRMLSVMANGKRKSRGTWRL